MAKKGNLGNSKSKKGKVKSSVESFSKVPDFKFTPPPPIINKKDNKNDKK